MRLFKLMLPQAMLAAAASFALFLAPAHQRGKRGAVGCACVEFGRWGCTTLPRISMSGRIKRLRDTLYAVVGVELEGDSACGF